MNHHGENEEEFKSHDEAYNGTSCYDGSESSLKQEDMVIKRKRGRPSLKEKALILIQK
jgi:hypothetical protein